MDPQLQTVITSGSDGKFGVELAPGIYTVVAEIDGHLYLNSYEGAAGMWSSITVTSGAWVDQTISDTSHATF